jgi:Flp pilus assembly protein TadG
MLGRLKRRLGGLRRRTEAGVSVEFALLIVVFLTIVAAIIDFGHAYYMQQVITNASREGARYGSRYQTNAGGSRILPNNLSPSITDWINNNYQNLLPADASLSTTISGAGATSGKTGEDLRVSVNAIKNWFLIHHLVPNMTDHTTLSAATVMKCE